MPTTTFSVGTGDDDRCGFYSGGSWPPSGGTFSENTFWGGATNPELEILRYFNGTYYSEVALVRFDTSAIGAGATINSATLKLVWTYKSITDANIRVIADYYDFGGDTVVAADWIEIPSPNIFTTPVDFTAVTTGVVTNHALSDFTGINGTGYTGIRLNFNAGSGGAPTGDNSVRFATVEHATYAEPQLEIDYTAGGSSSETDSTYVIRTVSSVLRW